MKTKHLIEVEKTNHSSSVMYDKETYSTPGFYLNTDENGAKSLIFVPKKYLNYPIAVYDWGGDMAEFESMLGEPIQEFPETKLETTLTDPGIDGETLLKAIVIAQNPELVKDIFK